MGYSYLFPWAVTQGEIGTMLSILKVAEFLTALPRVLSAMKVLQNLGKRKSRKEEGLLRLALAPLGDSAEAPCLVRLK